SHIPQWCRILPRAIPALPVDVEERFDYLRRPEVRSVLEGGTERPIHVAVSQLQDTLSCLADVVLVAFGLELGLGPLVDPVPAEEVSVVFGLGLSVSRKRLDDLIL